MKTDRLLSGALLYDGSSAPPFEADVLIRDRKILRVAKHAETVFPSAEVHSARGLCLAPGFIDVHGHSDISILADPRAFGKISQGITAEIAGNCGLSVFPVAGEVREHLQEVYAAYGVPIAWDSFHSYAAAVEARGPAIHLAVLCGHNTLRAAVLGYSKKEVSPPEVERMKSLLREALRQGAAGFSTGLIYNPGRFSSREELLSLMDMLREFGRPYATHLRSEGDALTEALEEALELAGAGGGNLQVSHLKTALPRNHHKLDRVFERIESARARGLRVHADRYPYTFSQTSLAMVLPEPFALMDDVRIRDVLRGDDSAFRDALAALEGSSRDWSRVILTQSRVKSIRDCLGKTLADAARERGVSPAEFCLALLREDAPGTMAAFGGMSEVNLERILAKNWVCCGTDESARPPDDSLGRSHPRGFGSFPRFIAMAAKSVPLEEVIRRITSMPAGFFGLRGRGMIREGYFADMVLFDAEKLDSRADFLHPHRPVEGIRTVFVNGEVAYSGESGRVSAGNGCILHP
ncbi:MAG: D-aminoacylase [Lentisphaerae bacterium ADurb.Bin242]|nr:MAG: D-aminoacylase [Lentisphaerae bacterium ADurb.Bin242]